MPNRVPPPLLDMYHFGLNPVSVVQQIRNQSGDTVAVHASGPGQWRGSVGWNTRPPGVSHPRDCASNEALLRAFHSLLQGLDNEVFIRLPDSHQPSQFAEGVVATLARMERTTAGLRARITFSGSASLAIGNYLNIGDRLYMVRVSEPPLYTLFPNVPPVRITSMTDFGSIRVTVRDVGVLARLDGTREISQTGPLLALITYSFTEV